MARPRTTGAELVLMDTSAILSFVEAGQVLELARYLAGRGSIVPEVGGELERNQRRSKFKSLAIVGALRPPWPSVVDTELPPDLRLETAELIRAANPPGTKAEELRHVGEVATVLMAQHLREAGSDILIVMDDTEGVVYARARRLPFTKTSWLAAEMTAAGSFDAETGFAVFEAAKHGGGRQAFEEMVREYAGH